MDRWCKHCNKYQAARICDVCKKATDELMVWSPGTPKIRCVCRAPFEGLHLANETGVPFRMGWKGTLDRDVLTVDIELRSAGKVVELGAGKPSACKALRCPHCSREMLLARSVNFTRAPAVTKLELRARPDGGVIMWAVAVKGNVSPGAS